MDDLALVHIGLQEELHYNACFLVCHTAFLRAFYSLMRISGYQGRELYWDIESDRQYGMQNAALWQSFGGDDGKGGPIPDGPFRQMKCGVLPNTKKPGYSVIQPHFVTRHFNSDWNRKPMIKGDMLFSAVCEPAFWTLHAEIDRLWRSWQFRHNRYFDYEGHRRIRRNDGSTEEKLASLDDTIDFYGLFEKIQVRDVMHPRRGILCYRYDKLVGGGPDNAM
uniref:Di-copper centre-containing n=1 Tax=Melanopsichium pennsylvanicum 4 TaxID=1398559 RepID=A0A077QRG5_9BASI|nr:di-copper centre-containing [Melanopsichium pennsylvanicum 4]